MTYIPFTWSKNDLDCDLDNDPEDVPIYTGHSLLNTKMHMTLLLIVQSLLHCNPPTTWIKIIQIAIQIEYLQGTNFLDPVCDLDTFAPCKLGKSNASSHLPSRSAAPPGVRVLMKMPSFSRPASAPTPIPMMLSPRPSGPV